MEDEDQGLFNIAAVASLDDNEPLAPSPKHSWTTISKELNESARRLAGSIAHLNAIIERIIQQQYKTSIRPGRAIMKAIPKLKGLKEIIEKLPQNSPVPPSMVSIISELNHVLESLCRLSFTHFSWPLYE